MRLKANAGSFAAIQWLVVCVFLIALIGLGAFSSDVASIVSTSLAVIGAVVGYASREAMVDALPASAKALRLLAFLIVGLAIAQQVFNWPLRNWMVWVFFCVTAFYLSAYFWVLSDFRVELKR